MQHCYNKYFCAFQLSSKILKKEEEEEGIESKPNSKRKFKRDGSILTAARQQNSIK